MCVEVLVRDQWRTAHARKCVPGEPKDNVIHVRDSGNPDTVLHFTVQEWDAFIVSANNGEFNSKE